jgi:hypothetical protein
MNAVQAIMLTCSMLLAKARAPIGDPDPGPTPFTAGERRATRARSNRSHLRAVSTHQTRRESPFEQRSSLSRLWRSLLGWVAPRQGGPGA